jgi:hypothetical protein
MLHPVVMLYWLTSVTEAIGPVNIVCGIVYTTVAQAAIAGAGRVPPGGTPAHGVALSLAAVRFTERAESEKWK